MNILQMVDVPWDSGLAHYALSVSKEFQNNGHRVWVSTIRDQKPWAKAERLGLTPVPLATWRSLPRLRHFLKKEQIDIVNAHTGATHSLSVMASIGTKAAIVRTRSDARAVRKSLGSSFIYKRTARVIAAAEYIRKEFITTLKLPPQKVVTVYQGVDTKLFQAKPISKSGHLGIMARLDPVKGHAHLIRAFALLKPQVSDLHLYIAGRQENTKEAELKTLAERLEIGRYVHLLGFKTDIAAFMHSCSMGVISSTGSEAVSRVALEWMACGRPLVSTRVGCMGEIIQHLQTGLLVEPKNDQDLADAIGKILHDPIGSQAMAARARQRVEQTFSMDVFYRTTLAVYHQALASSV